MPDLHGWLAQQIAEAEDVARAATPGPWLAEPVVYGKPEDGYGPPSNFEIAGPTTAVVTHQEYEGGGIHHGPDADHIARHDPQAVLRRCAADRKILEEHRPMGGGDPSHYACYGCGFDGGYCPEPYTEHVNDCPTLLALAEGYGLTEEQRTALDRPEPERPEPRHGFLVPEALFGPIIRMAMADVPPALRGPDWKDHT